MISPFPISHSVHNIHNVIFLISFSLIFLTCYHEKLEDGHVKQQSRLDQEEEAKAALLGRIQRLTKLILVSTKTSQASRFPERPGSMRRHSFGEDEVSPYLLSVLS